MPKCSIKWINPSVNFLPTPDDNDAVGQVRRKAYTHKFSDGETIDFDDTEWYNICAEHAKRLKDLDLKHWEFKPYENQEGNKS